MVFPEALHERLSSYLVNLFLTAPSLSQHAALAAFDELPELAKSVESYARNRAALRSALAAMGIEKVAPPDGAFYLYADIGHLTDDSLGFCQRLLGATGVATAPGIDFDPIDGKRWIRFSFAVSEPEVAQAIALLGPWLAQQPRR